MSLSELVLILALVGYALYRQSQRHEVIGNGRFKMAIIYGIVGLALGGLKPPAGFWPWMILLISLALSAVAGYFRGQYTRIWTEDGRVFAQGTALTIGIFVVLVVAKFAIGTIVYLRHIHSDGGFGEILLMIGIMVAFNAEIIWRRGKPMGARQANDDPAAAPPAAPA